MSSTTTYILIAIIFLSGMYVHDVHFMSIAIALALYTFEEGKIMNNIIQIDAYSRARKAAQEIWEDLCDRSCVTDEIDDDTRDEMIEEWREIIYNYMG